MTDKDLEQRHLDTLDRDLGRLSSLDRATSYASRPFISFGISLIFIILAGLVALYLFGNSSNTVVIVIAAGFGAYMALNIGANDVANNMGPAVGANALTMGGAIAIAAIFESAGALLAGEMLSQPLPKGLLLLKACKRHQSLSGQC